MRSERIYAQDSNIMEYLLNHQTMCRKWVSVSDTLLNFSNINSSINRLAAASSSNCWSCNIALILNSEPLYLDYHRTAVKVDAGQQTVLVHDRSQGAIINECTASCDRTLQAVNLFQPTEPVCTIVTRDHGRQCVLVLESRVPYLSVLAQHEHVTCHAYKKYIRQGIDEMMDIPPNEDRMRTHSTRLASKGLSCARCWTLGHVSDCSIRSSISSPLPACSLRSLGGVTWTSHVSRNRTAAKSYATFRLDPQSVVRYDIPICSV